MKLKTLLFEKNILIKEIAKKIKMTNYRAGKKLEEPQKMKLDQVKEICDILGYEFINKNGENIFDVFQ